MVFGENYEVRKAVIALANKLDNRMNMLSWSRLGFCCQIMLRPVTVTNHRCVVIRRFVGVAWSICGVHDQGWAERAVFGKVSFVHMAAGRRGGGHL